MSMVQGTSGSPAAPVRPLAHDGAHRGLLSVREPLDMDGADRFLERVRPLCLNCGCMVVDLAQAEFVDSSGVRALLRLAEELEAEGKELRLVVTPGSRVERTLNLLHLLDRFHTYPTLAEAWSTAQPS